jgi:flagellar protein FliO/FliZ
MGRFLFSLCGLLVATSARAQTAKFADPAIAASLPDSGVSSMGRVTVALSIVLLLLFVSAWAMRRFNLLRGSGQAAIELVQGINLGPKERAVLIKVDNRRLLLGVAPGCVNLLMELAPDNGATDTEGHSPLTTNQVNTPNFKALLKRSMGMSS